MPCIWDLWPGPVGGRGLLGGGHQLPPQLPQGPGQRLAGVQPYPARIELLFKTCLNVHSQFDNNIEYNIENSYDY